MVSLSLDAMSVAEGIKSNIHTNEIVGFNFNSLKTDVILSELKSLCDKEMNQRPKRMKELNKY